MWSQSFKMKRSFLFSFRLKTFVDELKCSPKIISYSDQLRNPCFLHNSLQFILPTQWAAEVPRRLSTVFPNLAQRQAILYLQSFIHPSFTLKAGEKSTMKLLEPLGEAILMQVVEQFIYFSFQFIHNDEHSALLKLLTCDASLMNVVKFHWCLDDLILADNSIQLFAERRNLVQWIEKNELSTVSLPDSYVASFLKSFVGAVFFNHGVQDAKFFCCDYVLPYLH